jgi:hypothetical protein
MHGHAGRLAAADRSHVDCYSTSTVEYRYRYSRTAVHPYLGMIKALLRGWWAMAGAQMRTVACAGRVWCPAGRRAVGALHRPPVCSTGGGGVPAGAG